MALIEELLNMKPGESFPFPKDFTPRGWVYVLSNPSMPSMYKIGLTRLTPNHRANQLSKSSGSPTEFVVEAKFISANPERDEKLIHESLSRFRVSQTREFFSCSLEKILTECRRFLPFGEARAVEDIADKFNFVTFDDYFLAHDTDFMLDEMGISAFGSKGNAFRTLAYIGASLVRQLTQNGGTFVYTGEGFALVKPLSEEQQ
ncbi:GIY-YIG nuclease family protein [Cronobacter malonaticus]